MCRHAAMSARRRRQLDTPDGFDATFHQIERIKAGAQAKVEHPTRQFGHTKTRYEGLVKNTVQIICHSRWATVHGAQGLAEDGRMLEFVPRVSICTGPVQSNRHSI